MLGNSSIIRLAIKCFFCFGSLGSENDLHIWVEVDKKRGRKKSHHFFGYYFYFLSLYHAFNILTRRHVCILIQVYR